jgi:hypothetical protein
MPLSQIIKNNFKFLSLTFFVFFISCVVQAQNPKSIILPEEKGKVESLLAIKPEEKTAPKQYDSSVMPETAIEKNNSKNKIQKSAKLSKKPIKKSPKISKKNKKKLLKNNKKRIIKKVKITKNVHQKKTTKNVELNIVESESEEKIKNEETIISNIVIPKIEERERTDASLEKYKKGELDNVQEIDDNYIIESELKENCDRAVAGQCFRADKFFQESYFHYTILSIFHKKIIAEQFFEGEGRASDKVFLKVSDGEYLLYTKNKNKIFLVVKNGLVEELVVLDGDLSKESKIVSKCQYADKLLAFHRLYQTQGHNEETLLYSDKKNFKGLIDATIFSEKYRPKILYSTFKVPNKAIRAVQNLNLCKVGDSFQAIERDFTKGECDRKFRCTMENLAGYGSEGFSVNDKNFTYDDFNKDKIMISLSREQATGLAEEVAKLSAEDKNLLKSKCFNDKNIDLISCSVFEKCQDYLVVEACEVNYFYNANKENN